MRLITYLDLGPSDADPHVLSFTARLAFERADKSSVVLIDGRGWDMKLIGKPQEAVQVPLVDLVRTARDVVGPDGPEPGTTAEDSDAAYWQSLAARLGQANVDVRASELSRLRHDVYVHQEVWRRLLLPGLRTG